MSETKRITVTLTDSAPITLDPIKWPVVAIAKDWDNQYECQANRTWRLTVRQHEDGRAVVYGNMSSAWGGERDTYAGERVSAGQDIPTVIRRVAADCGCEQIAHACIADLPAVEVE